MTQTYSKNSIRAKGFFLDFKRLPTKKGNGTKKINKHTILSFFAEKHCIYFNAMEKRECNKL